MISLVTIFGTDFWVVRRPDGTASLHLSRQEAESTLHSSTIQWRQIVADFTEDGEWKLSIDGDAFIIRELDGRFVIEEPSIIPKGP